MRQVLHCCEACGQPIDEWEKVLEIDGVQTAINAVMYCGKAERLVRGSMILLRLLMIRGRLSNEAFMMATNSDAESSTAGTYVCYLRRALKALGAPLVIQTVYGWGHELRRPDGTAATPIGRAYDALSG